MSAPVKVRCYGRRHPVRYVGSTVDMPSVHFTMPAADPPHSSSYTTDHHNPSSMPVNLDNNTSVHDGSRLLPSSDPVNLSPPVVPATEAIFKDQASIERRLSYLTITGSKPKSSPLLNDQDFQVDHFMTNLSPSLSPIHKPSDVSLIDIPPPFDISEVERPGSQHDESIHEPAPSTAPEPETDLDRLLKLSNNRQILTNLQKSGPLITFNQLFQHYGWCTSAKKGSGVRKLAEASFSDVYVVNAATVIKVIPTSTSVRDHCTEIEISHKMSRVPGYVPVHGTYVVSGPYNRTLYTAWSAFKGGEDAVNTYPRTPMFSVVVMPNLGVPLDSIPKCMHVMQVLTQVTSALAFGEQTCGFEHRDLHAGNVLVSRTGSGSVKCTVIDYTLSRVHGGLFTEIPHELGIGEHPQRAVYRKMDEVMTGSALTEDSTTKYAGYYPKTNVLWIQYLITELATRTTSPKTQKVLAKLHTVLDGCDSASSAISHVNQLLT